MNTFFEVKVKYEKLDSNGKEKMVTETYLIDAVSFSEAEERTHKELEPFISGEFIISAMKIANYSEVMPSNTADKYFKAKISFVSMDEESGVERKSNTYVLVQADNTTDAVTNIEEAFQDSVVVFEIPAVIETPIIDVFTYTESTEENKE